MEIRCMQCMELYEDTYEICPHCGFIRGTKPKEIYHLHPEMELMDRYIIGTVLGFGGFGITYKAWDKRLERIVAIKEYYPVGLVNRVPGEQKVILYTGKGLKEFQSGLTRFLDEARNTAVFSKHENIVNISDFFEDNGTAYIVMEYLDGLSLKEYLQQNGGTIDVDTTIKILLSVIEALKAVHAKGILHRDISPDNIFVCSNDKVKLIDFGAARFSTGEEEKTLSIVLKPGYAPPEQYRSRSKQGPWTDIYALGATMYRAVTGEIPEESVNRVIEDNLKGPREINPDIPDYIDVSLMVAMSLEPELRFQNVKQFEDAILNKRKVISIAEDLKRRKKKRVITIGIAAGVILLAAIGSIGYYQNKKTSVELAEASISVWVCVDSDKPEAEEQRVASMLEEFQENYPQVTVETRCIPENAYEEQLIAAAQKGELPTVYENPFRNPEVEAFSRDISDIMEDINTQDYFYLEAYNRLFPEGKVIPTGFDMPVIYENVILEDGQTEEGTLEEFLGGTVILYHGNVQDYNVVQQAMVGRYQVYTAEDMERGWFVDYWSVNEDCSYEEAAAGKRLIYYFLGERTQDIMYVQNTGGLPLNKNEFDIYISVNEELDFLSERAGQVEMINSETEDKIAE